MNFRFSQIRNSASSAIDRFAIGRFAIDSSVIESGAAIMTSSKTVYTVSGKVMKYASKVSFKGQGND